ncbi:bifunctional adenosylcobinamide kinase/adenosylcobinamide-phosphate guanylyltransferase [Ignavigranum ruoffiae]|uniref:Adenosylcobinamide kinase n=1 Tax=Ignavigranum ruoffiae TaxID=89093 RepID=A0A1H9CIG9_9LACT|nr:bifunctional adenosylcobinamide kinase/adenosylcobinamide-phosphate guanylyltransferase [Ignavigranum ruoffiae]SEQ00817.1 adenosylcobinamide kinase /adenosylcobinamide-phosphate guanylyltransferase [Ignavigranum ruoffiae]
MTGGAKSGKSSHAEKQIIDRKFLRVAYIATQANDFKDTEIIQSIKNHRMRRPKEWVTYETFKNIDCLIRSTVLLEKYDAYLIDCVTLWANNQMFNWINEKDFQQSMDSMTWKDWQQLENDLLHNFDLILTAMKETNAEFWIVSNEVGSGIVPEHKFVRIYRNLIGKINQKIAMSADNAYISISGILVKLK